MTEGTVKFFHDRKGYGFIERNDTDEDADDDVFFHMEDVEGPDLEEGEEVRFEVEEADEGPRAKNLERL
jgi:CspA family cold shock protein